MRHPLVVALHVAASAAVLALSMSLIAWIVLS